MTIKYLTPPTHPISYSWHGTRFMICNLLGSLLFQSVLRCSHHVPIKFSMCSPNMFPIAYVSSALPNVVLSELIQVQMCKYWDLYVYVSSEYFMCLSLFGSFDSQCSQVVLGEKCEIKNKKMVKFVTEKTQRFYLATGHSWVWRSCSFGLGGPFAQQTILLREPMLSFVSQQAGNL